MTQQGTRSCASCASTFLVDERDLRFYERISPVIGGTALAVPPPTHCPDCRRQRRLAWRNEKRLYRRTCDLTGQQILSIYSPDKPFKVYEQSVWHSDAWDPMAYGREFDFNRPFFAQWDELHRAVPLPSMNLRYMNENSEYTNLSARNKNCYLIFASNDNEDCAYSTFIHRCHRAVDCFFTFDCESCYECVDCYDSNNLSFSQYSRNCTDAALLYACQGCSNCIGCVNLVNAQYHVFNQPVSKEAFADIYRAVMGSRTARIDALARREELRRSLPHAAMAGFGYENCTGDHISFSRDVQDSYDITFSEELRYCVWFHRAKHCYDCYGWGLPGELGLENHLLGNGFYNVLFSESCANDVANLLYCRYCENGSKDLFGCIGLRRKQHCILNKQYTKEDYEDLVPKIIAHMRTTGEWGEFFPHRLSPYGYNETVAQEYYPITEDEARRRGWNWRSVVDEFPAARKIIPGARLPDAIAGVPDDVLQWAIACEATGRPFKIVKQELAFYRERGLPLPTRCFDRRHQDRMALRNPRRLWDRPCGNCGTPLRTSFSPERPERVFCGECYRKHVY